MGWNFICAPVNQTCIPAVIQAVTSAFVWVTSPTSCTYMHHNHLARYAYNSKSGCSTVAEAQMKLLLFLVKSLRARERVERTTFEECTWSYEIKPTQDTTLHQIRTCIHIYELAIFLTFVLFKFNFTWEHPRWGWGCDPQWAGSIQGAVHGGGVGSDQVRRSKGRGGDRTGGRRRRARCESRGNPAWRGRFPRNGDTTASPTMAPPSPSSQWGPACQTPVSFPSFPLLLFSDCFFPDLIWSATCLVKT